MTCGVNWKQKWSFFHFFIMANFLFLSTPREAETQTLGSVIWNFGVQQFFAKLEPFFYFLIMVIFPFFHKERCQFTASVNTQRSRNPIFGRIGNLKFWCLMVFFEVRAIFHFFKMTNTNFSLLQFHFHYAISSLVQYATFKYDDVSVLKT